MNKTRFGERFRYWFDGIMAKGTIAIIGLLFLLTVFFIAVISAVVAAFSNLWPDGSKTYSFPEAMWNSLMRTLDSGTMGGDEGTGYRVAMLIITIGGVIVVASLIGVISGAFDSKVEDLRKGKSRVLETEHTLILGWSPKVFPIISELVIANESRKKARIVVLADRDKVEMDDEIRAQLGSTGNTKVICRSGDPMNLADLELASPHSARSVIVLSPEDNEDPDSVVIKTTLALTNNPRRKADKFHIVGEIQNPDNLEAARLVGKDEAHWILAGDLISRITVQSTRQSGLSVVYSELLDFDGDEIYFTEQPTLVGTTYFDTQFAFADAAVMGIVKAGTVHLNPAAETIIESGDQLIVIAEDDDKITLGTPGTANPSAISEPVSLQVEPEQTLVLGYNVGVHAMIRELAEYVTPGSSLTVVADIDAPQFESTIEFPVEFIRADTTSRAVLEGLEPVNYEHIIVLPYKETLEPQRADAKTLITLLHLREIGVKAGADLNVVSEMLDDRNRELAEVTQADDFIVSDKLISLMLSQVSENKQLTDVFDTLFSSAGSEIYLRPAELYITPGQSVDFYTVLEAARRRGETAIGYRIDEFAHTSDKGYGVSVNPAKGEVITFVPGDKVVVLAED